MLKKAIFVFPKGFSLIFFFCLFENLFCRGAYLEIPWLISYLSFFVKFWSEDTNFSQVIFLFKDRKYVHLNIIFTLLAMSNNGLFIE